MKKKLAVLALALTLLTVPAAAFSDVDSGLYYAAPIAWAVEKGITTGTTETTFSPDALCTQGQIITFLWRAAGSPQVEAELAAEMPDLNPDFQKAVAWGYDAGILSGADFPHGAVPVPAGAVLFNPSAPCTRGTAMNFLWRYAGSPDASASGAFTDVDPDAGCAQAVAWAVEAGITSGTSETTFSPNEPCTRGQIATFLYRCLNEAGGQAELPEAPAPASAPEPDENVRPQQVLTGAGRAYSLGLDGSEFTADGVYEAEATVEIYSPYDAVFTVKVPFPLYQACSYAVRFDDPERPGAGYMFTFLRWDEAFADMIPWEGDHQSFRFTDSSGGPSGYQAACSLLEEHRTDGELSWRVAFPEDSGFHFGRLDGYDVSCVVNTNP